MIAHLKGTIIDKGSNYLVVDVNGIGYKVFVNSTLVTTSTFNDIISLSIYTNVKEDEINLFGFKNKEDLNIFELLLEVSGVGPKTALAIVNGLSAGNIITAVQKAKVDEFTKIPGIGKKVSQKIILELQGKIGKISELNLIEAKDTELVEALKNLGYTHKEAIEMSKGIPENKSLQEKIKMSLKR